MCFEAVIVFLAMISNFSKTKKGEPFPIHLVLFEANLMIMPLLEPQLLQLEQPQPLPVQQLQQPSSQLPLQREPH